MIITGIFFLGLFALTIVLGVRYNWKLALVVLVPTIYAAYFVAATEVPKRFGYAIAINFAEFKNQARFIAGYEAGERLYLLIIEKGIPEPRLISIANTPGNKKVLQDLQQKVKKGQAAIVRKGRKQARNLKGDGSGKTNESDIEGVEMKDQNIISKGE